MADITVPVPDARVGEFYHFFAHWLEGPLDPGHTSPETSSAGSAEVITAPIPWGSDPDQDHKDALTLWSKYSKSARAMFSLLMDQPDMRFTGEEIATEIGLAKGAHGVAGVLAWPGRHGAKMNRSIPSAWAYDADTGLSHYWFFPETAEVFKAARADYDATERGKVDGT